MKVSSQRNKNRGRGAANSPLMLIVAAAIAALGLWLMTGCIENNIPYPRIKANFTEFEAEGLTVPAEIDSASRIITLTLAETTDMRAVNVTSYRLTPGASIVGGDLNSPLDLTSPYIATLRIYQDYDWVIRASQPIERYFTVDGQIGATVIDPVACRVVVTVPENPGARAVKVLTQKLGAEGASETPSLAGTTVDMTEPVSVTVEAFGQTETWEIYCRESMVNVSTTSVDAWTQVAWVYGAAIEGRDNGVEYRPAGTDTWTKAPADWVTHTGSTFYARLIHLSPSTSYEARAYSDDEVGATVEFTTGDIPVVPNMSFSEWSQDGKVWQPWGEGQEPYWDSGNKGAVTVGDSNVQPTTVTSTGTGRGALLKTENKVLKLVAGSLFTGRYVATDGTNGVLSFGRPFTQRPTRLRGYLKYKSAPISHSSEASMRYMIGQPDTCVVWCALIDCNDPIEIRTKASNRQLFDENASYVVAYGRIQYGETIPDFIPFEFELNYRSTSRVPKYIIIVSSSSKYGDYFTGGDGSELYIDDYELLYDY